MGAHDNQKRHEIDMRSKYERSAGAHGEWEKFEHAIVAEGRPIDVFTGPALMLIFLTLGAKSLK